MSFGSFLRRLTGSTTSRPDRSSIEQERADLQVPLNSLVNPEASPNNEAFEPETLSASVDIEDLIGEYDESNGQNHGHIKASSSMQHNSANSLAHSSQRDHNSYHQGSLAAQSHSSFDNLISGSQSYKTAKGNDETTSFYSALHDGFSLDDYEWRDKFEHNFVRTKPEPHSSIGGNHLKEMMLQAGNFEVLWSDLSYSINQSKTRMYCDLYNFKRSIIYQSVASGVSNAFNLCPRFRQSAGRNRDYLSREESLVNDNSLQKTGTEDCNLNILQNLNGSFRSGELTAIMGPSGAGKTSLINILSLRREFGFSGQLYVELENDGDEKRKIIINAIPQHDHLHEYMTVRENLLFASRLKNSSGNHELNVQRVSKLLGLDICLDIRTKKISGGQQKRLAIAQELLSRPDILILDEPTSGLDSNTCLKTLSVLRDLVKASAKKIIDPIAVVLTIHQPQQEAFESFDRIYVMSTGGLVIYDGPPKDCVAFVQKHTGISMPSADYNPASFMIDIAAGEYGQEVIRQLVSQVRLEFNKARAQRSNRIGNRKRTKLKKQIDVHTRDSALNMEQDYIQTFESRPCNHYPSKLQGTGFRLDQRLVKGSSINSGDFLYKTSVLTERCWLSMVRDPRNLVLKILFHLMLPFGMAMMMGPDPGQVNVCPKYRSEYSLIGLLKTDEFVSTETQNEMMLSLENLGLLFITIYACISANIATMTLMFTIDIQSSLREYNNGWYATNSYLTARILSNIPLDLLLPTATMALLYVTTGQNTGSSEISDLYRIMITAMAVVLSSCTAEMMGMIFGTIYIGHPTTAGFASQGATLPFVLLSGFVARTKNMSSFVRALSRTSLFRHCLEITFIARYGWNVCGCDPNDKQIGSDPRITGVPEKMRKFLEYWQDSQSDMEMHINGSTQKDIFQTMAKQISLYNTYGVDVKSCDQVIPYLLLDFGLSERDLLYSFAALSCLLLVMLVLLVLVVKFVLNYRACL